MEVKTPNFAIGFGNDVIMMSIINVEISNLHILENIIKLSLL